MLQPVRRCVPRPRTAHTQVPQRCHLRAPRMENVVTTAECHRQDGWVISPEQRGEAVLFQVTDQLGPSGRPHPECFDVLSQRVPDPRTQ